MTTLTGGGGGGTGGSPSNSKDIVFTNSCTWSPPFDCKAIVHAYGGGGSGAIASIATGSIIATGGGGGEHSFSYLTLEASRSYTVTVGARGATPVGYASGTGRVGYAGGASSFSGTGITTITANGGGGGLFSTWADNNARSIAGGAGGTSGAGQWKLAGGPGGLVTVGAASADSSFYRNIYATGGGSAGIWVTGGRGGNIYKTNNSRTARCGTGGGGINGNGGDMTINESATWMDHKYTFGGSLQGSAGDAGAGAATLGAQVSANANILLDTTAAAAGYQTNWWNNTTRLDAGTAATQNPGVGGRGYAHAHETMRASQAASLFAGGGGYGGWGVGSGRTPGPGGEFGGGSGGCGGADTASAAFGNEGGAGGVMIEIWDVVV